MRSFTSRITAAVAALAVATGLLVFAPAAPAEAAVAGAGLSTSAIGHQGVYRLNSSSRTLLWCLDPGLADPFGSTSPSGYAGPGFTSTSNTGYNDDWSATQAFRVAHVINQYGTWDALYGAYSGSARNERAAAVSLAVKYLSNRVGLLSSHGNPNGTGTSRAEFDAYVNWVFVTSFGTGVRDRVANAAWAIIQEANSLTATPGFGTPGGQVEWGYDVDDETFATTVTIVPNDPYSAASTGTLTLDGGYFLESGSATMNNAVPGIAYGVAPYALGDGSFDTLSISGSFTTETGGWVRLYSTPGQQRAGGASIGAWNVEDTDPYLRDGEFIPGLTTSTARYIEPHSTPTDAVTITSVTGPWPQRGDGTYLEVIAEGTLYGPLSAEPVQSATVPADAPVAATATVSTGDAGPGTYTASASAPVTASGWYTWVWTIDWAVQPELTQVFTPEGFVTADDYGIPEETAFVRGNFTATTAVTETVVRPGAESRDHVTVGVAGFWPTVSVEEQATDPDTAEPVFDEYGNAVMISVEQPIPVTVRSSLYHVRSASAPAQSSTIPASATLIGSTTDVVTQDDPEFITDGIATPNSVGWVVWVTEIRRSDQPSQYRDLISEWRSDFGIPEETAALARPEVRTEATPGVGLGEAAFDTAFISGELPVGGAQLTFEAFEVPMVPAADDPDRLVIDYPNEEAAAEGDLSWVCSAEPVFVSEPVVVAEPGSYTSDAFTPSEYGMYLWVETLRAGDDSVLHRGECGVAEETTFVLDVETRAQVPANVDPASVPNGVRTFDIATVRGYLPQDASITFEAYIVPKNSTVPLSQRCVDDYLVATVPAIEPVALAAGLYPAEQPLIVTSDSIVVDPDYESAMYWVEVTRDGIGREISRGECGDPNETLGLRGLTTEASGGSVAGIIGGTAALLLLGGAALPLLLRRRQAA